MALKYRDYISGVSNRDKGTSGDQENRRQMNFSLKKRMFFTAIVVGLFFGGLELTCFFARPLYINFRKLGLPAYAASNIPSTIKYTLRENELSHPDAGLLFHVQQNPSGEPIQGYTGINALGFRGNVYDPNLHSDDQTKVMILGDSCAFGWGILDYRLTFQSILEERLDEQSGEFKVYNFSQPGYSSSQGKVVFDRWFSLVNPDLLIIYFGWNDIWETPLLTDNQYLNLLRFAHAAPLKWIQKTHTYLAFESLYQMYIKQPASQHAKINKNVRVPMEDAIANFKTFVTAASEHNTEIILILPPVSNRAPRLSGILSYNNKIRDEFYKDAMVLNLKDMDYDSPNSYGFFFPDGFHPNNEGAKYIASQLTPLCQQIAMMHEEKKRNPLSISMLESGNDF